MMFWHILGKNLMIFFGFFFAFASEGVFWQKFKLCLLTRRQKKQKKIIKFLPKICQNIIGWFAPGGSTFFSIYWNKISKTQKKILVVRDPPWGPFEQFLVKKRDFSQIFGQKSKKCSRDVRIGRIEIFPKFRDNVPKTAKTCFFCPQTSWGSFWLIW